MAYFLLSILLMIPPVAWQTYQVAATGMRTRTNESAVFNEHQTAVWRWVWLLLSCVALIEFQLRTTVELHERNPLIFYPHLALDGVFAALGLAVLFRYNGFKAPRLHRWLVYPLFAVFLLVAVTGGILLIPYVRMVLYPA